MKYDPTSRRFFLQGLGGFILSLPVLPSLMPKAHAQVMRDKKFLVILGSEHGGTGYDDWYPANLRDPRVNPDFLNTLQLYSGAAADGMDHKIRWARLANLLSVEAGHPGGNVDNSAARLSYILGSHLNPYLDKMNFMRGIDVGPEYQGHGVGPISGNIAGVSNSVTYRNLPPTASLDQLLGNHPKFYTEEESISLKAANIAGRSLSYAADGTRLPRHSRTSATLFNNLFSKYEATPEAIARNQQKKFVVDKVHEDYKNLMSGAYGLGRKMASEDRLSVEQHIESLFSIQKKVTTTVNACSAEGAPSTNNHETNLDIVVAAFACGATRLCNYWCPITSKHPNYHSDVAHAAAGNPEKQLVHNTDFRWQSVNILGKLLDKLSSVDIGGGKNLLDQSLVYWQHESGVLTHNGYAVNLVSVGDAGGALKTGYFVDYRNMTNYGLARGQNFDIRPGLLVNQWWSTVLQAMGLNPADYEVGPEKGYGTLFRSTRYPYGSAGWHGHRNHLPYPERIYAGVGNKLPVIT